MRLADAARSIRTRIFAGFFLVLLLLGVLAGVVWHASVQVGAALQSDMTSEAAASQLVALRSALLETRLAVAAYLRTEAAAEHDAMNKAVSRLETLIAQTPTQGGTTDDVAAAARGVRSTLDRLGGAIVARHGAAASVVAASAALASAGTALAEGAARTGDKGLAAGGATLLGDVMRAGTASAQALAAEDQGQFEAALTASHQAGEVLASLREAAADSARIQRLGGAADEALTGLQTALGGLQAAIATRNQSEVALLAAAQRAETAVDGAGQRIAAEQNARRADTLAAQQALESEVLWAAAGAATLGVLIAAGLGLSITRPLSRLGGAMARLAEGQLDVDVPGTGARHEIGAMARAVEVFKAHAVERHRSQAEEKANAERAIAERHEMMLSVATGFESTVAGVVQGVTAGATRVEAGAQTVASAVEQTSVQANAVAAASEQAAVNVQSVAGAARQLSASIDEVASQVARAATTAQEATAATHHTEATVRDLTDAAQRIGDVVGLIHSIASQTNLLALNATIEAARAGDSGKGFAVVASEVKNLATQTAKATDDIAAQIGAMQTSTQQAVAAISGISGIVEQMDQIAGGISAAVEQQRAATQEIARGVQEAAAGTQEVSRNIAGVSEAAQASGKAANDVLGVAHELSTQATTLRAAMDGFLGTVRAA